MESMAFLASCFFFCFFFARHLSALLFFFFFFFCFYFCVFFVMLAREGSPIPVSSSFAVLVGEIRKSIRRGAHCKLHSILLLASLVLGFLLMHGMGYAARDFFSLNPSWALLLFIGYLCLIKCFY
ncbi:hypothetical protein ACQKWADRAFT_169261 [Trichoderma austrokoningii]